MRRPATFRRIEGVPLSAREGRCCFVLLSFEEISSSQASKCSLKKGPVRVEDNHAHASTRYKPIDDQDYPLLVSDVLETLQRGYESLNVHLPFQIQHPKVYPDLKAGLRYIRFGETLKNFFQIKLYWENAPEEVYGEWTLAHGQTDWAHVPSDIDLCLDTGHLMIGAESMSQARQRIKDLLKSRGQQIKHLHIHENDLCKDLHLHPAEIIDKKLLERLTKNRSYIFEKGE